MAKENKSTASTITGLVKQAQELQTRMNQMLNELHHERVQGASGGGMVTVTLNGLQEVIEIKIDKQVVDPEDVEMLEELIIAAMNNAQHKALELKNMKMSSLTGGVPLPDMLDMF